MKPARTFDVFPAQSQFRPGQTVQLIIHLSIGHLGAGSIEVKVFRQHKLVGTTITSTAELNDGKNSTVDIGNFATGGYHVVAQLQIGEGTLTARTAFDVKHHWRETPRYGFVSDYEPRGSRQDIQDFFRKFHLNVVQFYDWMERHDALVPTASEFVDPMGRQVFTDGILSRIRAMNDIETASIAYAAVYASLSDYAKAHPDEGLYDNQGVQHSLGDVFYVMDITENSSWTEHILAEFRKVIDFGFDGLHLDQYGNPKSGQRKDGSALWLDDAYTFFINACRQRLGKNAGLIFNNVSSYPVHSTCRAQQDAIYVEVWPPMVRYRHLCELITRIRIATEASKQAILAAYLKQLREDRDADPQAVTKSALLVTAVIYASGGHHLLLGESGGILTSGYYPEYVQMVPELMEPLRAMYDMVTADADLLSGPDVTDVSWSFVGGDGDPVLIDGAPISVEPEAGTVWVRVTTTQQGLVIHLVNLLWLKDDLWNSIHDEPFTQSPPLDVRFEWNFKVNDVLVQRAETAMWERVDPEWVQHAQGKALQVRVEPFDVWTMIFVPYETPSRDA